MPDKIRAKAKDVGTKKVRKYTKQVSNVSKETETKIPGPKGITADAIVSLKLSNPALTLAQGAKILGCHPVNIRKHLARHGTSWSTLPRELDDYKKTEADLLVLKTKQMLESISSSDIKAMSAHNRIVDAGILIDKRAVLAGKGNTGGNINISFTWGAPQGNDDAKPAQVVIDQE